MYFCYSQMRAGMSESSGPHTVCKMEPGSWNPASAGKDMLGVHTKILHPDAKGEGEVYTCTMS